MKKQILQIFRSIVTIVVVGMMAAMIFSLRGELRETKTKLAFARSELQEVKAQLAAATATTLTESTEVSETAEKDAQ